MGTEPMYLLLIVPAAAVGFCPKRIFFFTLLVNNDETIMDKLQEGSWGFVQQRRWLSGHGMKSLKLLSDVHRPVDVLFHPVSHAT